MSGEPLKLDDIYLLLDDDLIARCIGAFHRIFELDRDLIKVYGFVEHGGFRPLRDEIKVVPGLIAEMGRLYPQAGALWQAILDRDLDGETALFNGTGRLAQIYQRIDQHRELEEGLHMLLSLHRLYGAFQTPMLLEMPVEPLRQKVVVNSTSAKPQLSLVSSTATPILQPAQALESAKPEESNNWVDWLSGIYAAESIPQNVTAAQVSPNRIEEPRQTSIELLAHEVLGDRSNPPRIRPRSPQPAPQPGADLESGMRDLWPSRPATAHPRGFARKPPSEGKGHSLRERFANLPGARLLTAHLQAAEQR